MSKTVILDHPLIQHKITLLRDEKTGTRDFRILVEEIAMLMGYEAMRDLPTELVEVKTPIATAMEPMLSGKKLAVVPILRAGSAWWTAFWHWYPLRRSATSACTAMR